MIYKILPVLVFLVIIGCESKDGKTFGYREEIIKKMKNFMEQANIEVKVKQNPQNRDYAYVELFDKELKKKVYVGYDLFGDPVREIQIIYSVDNRRPRTLTTYAIAVGFILKELCHDTNLKDNLAKLAAIYAKSVEGETGITRKFTAGRCSVEAITTGTPLTQASFKLK